MTLEPGVEVQIESGRVFDVQGGGTLTAEGTDLAPISITAISGSFIGLRLWPNAHASLAHCELCAAGVPGYPAVDIQSSHVRLDHCNIQDNTAGSSIAVKLSGTGLSPTLTNTTIQNNSGYAIYQSTLDMAPTYANLILSGNGVDAVAWNSGYLNRPIALDGSEINGSPFVALDAVNVNSGGQLTLTAGTELLLPAGRGLYVQSGGVLTTKGTAAKPAILTARDPEAPFLYLAFQPGSSGSLSYCDLNLAGAHAYPAVDIQSSEVSLDHCTIHNNGVGSGAAVQLQGADGLSPSIKDTSILSNSGYAIYQTSIDMIPVYQNLTLSGNGTDAVAWRTGYLDRALILDGLQIGGKPFLALDTINVNEGGHLILNPGTELRMKTGEGLWVKAGGALTAEGTAYHPATLTAVDAEAPWVKLCFLPGSSGNLAYCDLSHAGASSSPALEIQSSDVHLDHCVIHDNVAASGAAVILSGAGLSPSLANTTIQDNSGRAVHQSTIDMTPVYTNLTFTGNDTDAVVLANGNLRRAVTLDGQQINGSPFVSLDDINVWDEAHLTLAPGTELQMAASKAMYVESGGALTGEGTATQPVALTSVDPAVPFLKVHFLPGSTTRLSHLDISHAGASGYNALAVYSPAFSASHCIVHDNAAWGTRLYRGAGSPFLDNMVFIDNAGGGLLVESDVIATLRHATVARNGIDGIRIRDGGTAILTNTIVARNETGVRVDPGGAATMAQTLWDGNTQDMVGEAHETGHVVGSAAFAADGYHLTAASAALAQGTDCGVFDDIDGDPRPLPPQTPPDLGADETGASLEAWHKWIDGGPWQPALSHSVETWDTVEVIDRVTAESSAPVTLTEIWDPLHLSLSGYTVDPPGAGQVLSHTGELTWKVASGHPETVTLTKRFHIEPCTWTTTTLHESLQGLEIPDPSRPVSFHKTRPELWIAARYDEQVHPGEIVTFTLSYGNDGGLETGVTVYTDLATAARLFDADPLPAWQAVGGMAADWQVGALPSSASGRINASLVVSPELLTPATLVITGSILNHAGQAAGWVTLTYQVSEPARHDVAMVGAAPSGEVRVGEPVEVTAELLNQGSEAEDGVPVRCTIKGPAGTVVYSETLATSIVPIGTFAKIEFSPWTAASEGSHLLTCQSTMPGDEDPANDLYRQILTASLWGAPDVWMKDNDEDTGEVPSGHPWWRSPDIWVRHQPDGGLVHQNPIAFQENTIYVRIRNRGSRAASGTVGVFWDRSRIGWPCKIWSPNVGTLPFENLPPGEVRIVHLTWVPQEPGHHGLHTVIDATGDPADWSAPCSPHRPRWDNNVSWSNVIAYFRPGRPTRALSTAEGAEADVVNPYDWPKELDLIIERGPFPPTGTITVQLAEHLFDRWRDSSGHWSQGVEEVTGTNRLRITAEVTATLGAIPMAAHEVATVALSFDAPGEAVCDVTLQERIDGLTVGGVSYRWLVSDVVPPEVEAHLPASGAVDVPPEAAVVITFTEEIGPLTLDLTLTPTLEGGHVAWNGAGTVCTATHPSWVRGTRYTASVTAKDAFANAMAAPHTWLFTVQEGWDLYLPVVVRNQ